MLLLTTSLLGDELDEAMDGFDETASENTFDEAALDGFDDFDDGSTQITAIEEERDINWYSLTGSLSFLSAYSYSQSSANAAAPGDKVMDFSGLSRARTKLDLALEMRHSDDWKSRIEVMGWYDAAWAIHGRDGYTDDVLDTYERFFDLKDAYIQGTLTSSLDIKIGRQIVIWGKSDSIRITDVINPLDSREPGMVDIEDLRLSETMTKLDYYFGDYGLSAMVIHEPRLPIEPAFGSDYRPRDVFGPTPAPDAAFPDRYEPDWSLENTQFALSLDGRYEGWDLSWYAANVFDSRFGIEVQEDGSRLRTYDKITMLGVATNVVSGSWLYKVEAAYIAGIDYRSVEDDKDRIDALLGIDYSGFSKTLLSLEIADRHLLDYEDIMLQNTLPDRFPDYAREDTVQVALRGNHTFDHDNASLNYLLSLFGSSDFGFEDGGFQRLWLEYKYSDTLSMTGGVVDYIGGDGTVPFYNAMKDDDRVFAELVYSF